MKAIDLTIYSLLCFSWHSIASGEVSNPVNIHSDDAIINYVSGSQTYSGNVVVEHFAFHLEADRVIEYKNGNETVRIVATGTPVKFERAALVNTGLSSGHAEKIDYMVSAGKLKLENYQVRDINGNIQQGKTATYIFKNNQ